MSSRVTQGGMAAAFGLEKRLTHAVHTAIGVVLANLNCHGQPVISDAVARIELAGDRAQAKDSPGDSAVGGRFWGPDN